MDEHLRNFMSKDKQAQMPYSESCAEVTEICSFCQKYGMCQYGRHKADSGMNMKIHLMRNCSFNAAAFSSQKRVRREYYQSGRMDMIFSLVDARVAALDVAADFAGMGLEEADDML